MRELSLLLFVVRDNPALVQEGHCYWMLSLDQMLGSPTLYLVRRFLQEDFFKRMASLWGTLVDIDKITSDRVHFDGARFAVHMTSMDPIRGIIHLKIINRNNLIQAEKEHTINQEVEITPKQIWDFISRVGVESVGDKEASIQQITELERRDVEEFLKFKESTTEGCSKVISNHS
ncbi:hypothetical protein Ancab_000532 [Ancistrocladus abbreviatus]